MKAALAAAQREHERISRHAQASLDAARTEHARVRREVDQLQAACAAAADKWTTLADGVETIAKLKQFFARRQPASGYSNQHCTSRQP